MKSSRQLSPSRNRNLVSPFTCQNSTTATPPPGSDPSTLERHEGRRDGIERPDDGIGLRERDAVDVGDRVEELEVVRAVGGLVGGKAGEGEARIARVERRERDGILEVNAREGDAVRGEGVEVHDAGEGDGDAVHGAAHVGGHAADGRERGVELAERGLAAVENLRGKMPDGEYRCQRGAFENAVTLSRAMRAYTSCVIAYFEEMKDGRDEPVRLKALRELALSTRYAQFSRLMDRKPVRELFLTDRTDGINEYTEAERQLAENIRQTLKTAGKVMFNEWGDATPIYRQLDAVCERPKPVAGNRVEIIDRIPVACHASPIKRVGNDIEIRPSAACWVFRYRIGSIAYDKDAEYVLRVRVKAVRKPGVPNDTAFTFGYYDLAKRLCEDYAGAKVSQTVSFGAWYELPARKFNDTLDFWFAPGDRAGDLLDSLTLTNIEIVRKEPPNEAARGFARSEFERCVTAMTGKAAPELKFTAAAKSEKLGLDGFRVLVKNGVIEIRSETGRAAIYGVYDILERFGGCGFYARNCEVLPKREKFVIPEGTDYVEKPAFGVRTALWTDARMDKDFGAKLRLDGWGNEPDWLHGGCDYLFTSEYGMCHTFTTQLPPAKYAAEHPEYYGLVDGKRYFEGFDWQPCLTNPDVLRIVTERMLEKLRAEPQAKFVGVSQNDTWFDRPNLCECENCRKVNEEEGSRAGTTVRFVNAVADAVAKEFPDKFVETLAYQFTRKPTKTAFRDNVIPCLCSIECDFAEPIDGGAYRENVSFCKDLKGWAKKSKQLYIWDYTTDYACFPLPMPNVKVLAPNLRLFRDAGVFGMMAQGAQQGRCAGFGELKQWLLSKLEWDPDQDTDVLTEEFLEARYGAAAGERLRALLMTALTTLLGTLPMMIASGAGAASRNHLGTTEFWGMGASVLFGILLVPGLYALFQTGRENVKRFFAYVAATGARRRELKARKDFGTMLAK